MCASTSLMHGHNQTFVLHHYYSYGHRGSRQLKLGSRARVIQWGGCFPCMQPARIQFPALSRVLQTIPGVKHIGCTPRHIGCHPRQKQNKLETGEIVQRIKCWPRMCLIGFWPLAPPGVSAKYSWVWDPPFPVFWLIFMGINFWRLVLQKLVLAIHRDTIWFCLVN